MTTSFYIELFGLFLMVALAMLFPAFKSLFTYEKADSTKKGERSQVLDFVRGIAMFAIVIIHIDSYFAFFHPADPELTISKWIANLSRFCVPAFIFSSGFFLSWKGGSHFWSSKLKSVLVPYLVVAIPGYFTKYPPDQFFTEIIPKLLLGQVFQPYYYVPLLFGFYLLFSLLFKNINQWSSRFFHLILFASLVINVWSNHFYPSKTPILGTVEAISFTNYLFFFVAGFSAKTMLTNKQIFMERLGQNKLFFPALLLAIFFYTIVVTYYSFLDRMEMSNHFLFYPIAIFIVLTYIGMKVETTESPIVKKVYKSMVYVGENSLAIFMLHPLTIHLMHRFDPYYMGGFYLAYLVTLAINIIVPLVVWKIGYTIIGWIAIGKKS